MRRSRFRLLAGVAIAGNVVAIAVSLARPPAPPDGTPTILDCTLFLLWMQLVIGALYTACVLYCQRGLPEDAPEATIAECINNCLRWWLWAEVAVVIAYLMCVVSTILYG
jgi:hypothetical protein